MSWFKRLFKKEKPSIEKEDLIEEESSIEEESLIESNKTDFSIEYYPLTNKYYAKYKKYYLKEDWSTGIVNKKEAFLFGYCDAKSKEECIRLINLYKEQQYKVNVETIEVTEEDLK